MITEKNGIFALETAHTSYLFGVTHTGHLEHLHYGRKIHFRDDGALREKHNFAPGNSIYYDDGHKNFSLEDACLEMSAYGKGDIREPFVEVVHGDGSFTSDFLYDSLPSRIQSRHMPRCPVLTARTDTWSICRWCCGTKDMGWCWNCITTSIRNAMS